MAGTLNKVMLIGHTGDEVKMHYFEGGNCIGRFPLATNEEYINKATNEKVSNTEWHTIVVRNKAAEVCEKYLKKGDKVYIEGRIKTKKWQDDKGMDRYSTEIQCLEFTFLTPKDPVTPQPPTQVPSAPQQQTASKPSTKPQAIEEEEDDLPF
ncbi:single-stranded DNA-binding protein Ssb [Psychroflexus torquis ATCC 700755]|uniref:Single-stranded DNA-binding protein n=1 Tax=Psychroflexus torquis (strain ATCC 700755 / CIP 106069 / ACAM 623) TaxID=313595 RepID=K4IS14_PSYTT|nr:single-stranded DNA-binding protein [Psychroflexus torquis]AFU68265.1 single-stranded DNA-binding protein Ssb [Psychroflexus torquis ATCC 700755]